jgi:hypothetical protein
MIKRGSTGTEIAAMRDRGDVAGLVAACVGTKRRDRRRAILAALAALGTDGRNAVLALLGDEDRQRDAGAVLVELGEDTFPDVAEQLGSDDEVRRRGALHAVYLYARYRDLPAAHELLRTVATDGSHPDLTKPAARMADSVQTLTRIRNEEIDRLLAKIKASIERDQADRGSTVLRMYASIHSGRIEARAKIASMRYAGVRHMIAVAPEYGEAVVGPLLALGLEEIGGGVVPILDEALGTDVRRTRSVLLTTLICLRRACVPGAAEALERHGVTVTEQMDRRAAFVYKRWVRER